MAEKKPKKTTTKAMKKPAPKRGKTKAPPKRSTGPVPEAKVSARKKKLVAGDEQYPMYDSAAKRGSYKVGDIVKFPAVRDWLSEGALVEAYGKVVGVGILTRTSRISRFPSTTRRS